MVVLGDRPLKSELTEQGCAHVNFLGDVNNVSDYLAASDYFISASLSESLPNTVLEVLAVGLPVILSDIDFYKEIVSESSMGCKNFLITDGGKSLVEMLKGADTIFDDSSVSEAKSVTSDTFTAQNMSEGTRNIIK